jgi:hypothetical protein
LTDNRNLQIQQQHEQQESNQQYRIRVAALEKDKEEQQERQKRIREMDIIGLLNEGYGAYQASYILNIPLSEVACIEEYNRRRWKFLMTGILDLPDQMAGVSIFQ